MIRARRFGGALRRSWLPILVGAAWAIAVAFVASAAFLVVLESQHVAYDFASTYAMAVSTVLLFAGHAGAVYGYITRR